MAPPPLTVLSFSLIFSVLIFSTLATAVAEAASPRRAAFPKWKKLSKLTLFWHDLVSGNRPTAVTVLQPAPAGAWAGTGFGLTRVMDNRLTMGPDQNSTEVGRARGIYAAESMSPPFSFLMAMNFVMTAGKYKGSTLTFLGPNKVASDVRELPLVGGTGMFRLASGYALLRTRWFDPATGDATVEYSVFVSHY